MESSRRRGTPVSARSLGWLVLGALLAACEANPRIPDELLHATPPVATTMTGEHVGPPVSKGTTGPARFVAPLHARFDPVRAFDDVRFMDGYYRAPGNRAYDLVLDHLEARLRAGGFGSKPGLELEFLESALDARGWQVEGRVPAEAWTPISGKLALVAPDGSETVLHQFAAAGDRDRVMLPIHTPSAQVTAPFALGLEDLAAGQILVTSAAPSASVLNRAVELGAVAVVSSYLEPYNVDPRGEWRELDAIQFGTVPYRVPIPVVRISPAAFLEIRNGRGRAQGVKLALHTEVSYEAKPLRTMVARVVGRDRPEEAVVIASHVQEPGACDNASGAAGLVESALALVSALEAGEIQRPSRSLVFVWGDEFRQTSVWLEHTSLVPIAGLSSDMTGESEERTGAIALLERMPDPASLQPLPPDQHTPWGAGKVDPTSLKPNGFAIIARCALYDVGALAGGWKTAEHPYEGGSDHDILIQRGIPAALFWHFTDFTYHTSLDRLENVDVGEMRRSACAILSTALALADPEPQDLQRYLDSLNEEWMVRARAAELAGDEAIADRWREWFAGARHWLRNECLRLPPPMPEKP